MTATLTIDCDFPDCRLQKSEPGRPTVAHAEERLEWTLRDEGWLLGARKTDAMPSWVPEVYDLCPIHRMVVHGPAPAPAPTPKVSDGYVYLNPWSMVWHRDQHCPTAKRSRSIQRTRGDGSNILNGKPCAKCAKTTKKILEEG